MRKSVLDTAELLLKRRKFSLVISLLETNSELYEDNFDYYITLGIACLYVGDAGSAASYFGKAREIRLTDSRLLLGQAAIFLRRGDTDRAIQYYLEVLNNDPSNKTALSAMEFIRKYGDYTIICKWVDTGKISRFYPSLGFNPDIIRNTFFTLFFAAIICAGVYFLRPKPKYSLIGPRANLERLELSEDEKNQPKEKDLTGTVVKFFLTDKEINSSYEKALQNFQENRDNACLVEINRLLNSNAAFSIKQKASTLLEYIKEPDFDSLTDNYTYAQISETPELYLDCWVKWSGRISNVQILQNDTLSCNLLVGYENMKTVEGIVPVIFKPVPVPELDGERPVQVLAKIGFDNGKIMLNGKIVYQPLIGRNFTEK